MIVDLTTVDLENIKMALVHSSVGWDKNGDPEDWVTRLLKITDHAMGEPNVMDEVILTVDGICLIKQKD